MEVVEPEPADLQRHSREDTRVFHYEDLHEPVGRLRSQLFDDVKALLGAERFGGFRDSLVAWMPVDDSNHGFGNSREMFTEARRERYYRSARQQPHAPGQAVLGWSVTLEPAGMGFHATRRVDEIPDGLVPHLQDWIEEARRLNALPAPRAEGQP